MDAPTPNAAAASGTRASRAADARAVVDAINAAEMATARLAARRASDPDVGRLATSFSSGHRQRVADLPPTGSIAVAPPVADSIRTAARADSARLAAVDDAAFDRAFVAAQIASHEHALAALDAVVAAAPPHELDAIVDATREDVRRHLDRARALQSRLR